MADVIVDEVGLQNIANVLRYKLNTNNTFLPSEMGSAVNNISSVPSYEFINTSYFFSHGARLSNLNTYLNMCNNSTNALYMFTLCENLTSTIDFKTSKINSMFGMYLRCTNLVNVLTYDTHNTKVLSSMFAYCNNLSNASIQNIVNMCLGSNVTRTQRNLNNMNTFSPLYNTKFSNTYYQNRWTELNYANWNY